MPPTLAQLIPPVTADEAKAVLLSTLAGVGPVQQVGQGAGTLVVSGSPVAAYDVVVAITTGGNPGAGAFQYSLNGGSTFNGPFTVPASGAYIPAGTGLTFQFAGLFNLGDQYLVQTIWPFFPVSDWAPGSGGRTFTEADAVALADLAGGALGAIAAGGFVDYAPGIAVNPNGNDWLSLLSHELYENDRFSPQAAVVQVALSLAASASALTVNPGDLTISNGPGGTLLYQNLAGATIMPGTTATVQFQAVQPGSAYNVQNNVLTFLQTPRAGLTCNNPQPGISAVTHAGSGAGTVAASGVPLGNYSVVVRITATGGLGAGAAQVSLDGVNYASPFTIPASGSYNVPTTDGTSQTGLTLTFAGASFASGDTYSFTAYALSVVTPGVDQESDPALQARDKGKWTGLGLGGGTAATFDYLCRQTPNGGSEVSRTSEVADTATPGQVDVTVAGINGPVSTTALANIGAYVAQYVGVVAKSVVANAGVFAINVTATVYVSAAQLAGAQTAVNGAFATLASTTPIGGLVVWSDIEAALNQKQAGVKEVVLTAPAPNTDTQLPANDVPSFNLAGVSYVIR